MTKDNDDIMLMGDAMTILEASEKRSQKIREAYHTGNPRAFDLLMDRHDQVLGDLALAFGALATGDSKSAKRYIERAAGNARRDIRILGGDKQ